MFSVILCSIRGVRLKDNIRKLFFALKLYLLFTLSVYRLTVRYPKHFYVLLIKYTGLVIRTDVW